MKSGSTDSIQTIYSMSWIFFWGFVWGFRSLYPKQQYLCLNSFIEQLVQLPQGGID
jgi:hypothetical protein